MLAMTVAPEGVGGRFGVGVGVGVGVPDGWEPEPEEDGALGDPVNAVVVVPVVAVPANGLAALKAPHPSIQNPVRVSTPAAQNRFRFTYIRQPFGRVDPDCQVKLRKHLLWMYRARVVGGLQNSP